MMEECYNNLKAKSACSRNAFTINLLTSSQTTNLRLHKRLLLPMLMMQFADGRKKNFNVLLSFPSATKAVETNGLSTPPMRLPQVEVHLAPALQRPPVWRALRLWLPDLAPKPSPATGRLTLRHRLRALDMSRREPHHLKALLGLHLHTRCHNRLRRQYQAQPLLCLQRRAKS
jgi:hypothetical protein